MSENLIAVVLSLFAVAGACVFLAIRNRVKTLPPVADLSQRAIAVEELALRQGGSVLWMAAYSSLHRSVVVFDVSSAPDFYGPKGGYKGFTGRDASRALATMSLNDTETDLTKLTADQHKTLLQWTAKFLGKYPVVGYLWPETTGLRLPRPRAGTLISTTADATAPAVAAATTLAVAVASANADDDDEGEIAYVDQRASAPQPAAATTAAPATATAGAVAKLHAKA